MVIITYIISLHHYMGKGEMQREIVVRKFAITRKFEEFISENVAIALTA